MKKCAQFLITITLLTVAHSLLAQGTAFTYQGQLQSDGSPASGNYDFTFALYNNSTTNSGHVGSTLTNLDLDVTNGLFTVTLDFGANFPGANRWLAIAVRTNGSASFTSLSPLQQLTAAPYSVFAGTAHTISGTLPSADLSGTYGKALTLTNAANSFSGNGGGLTNLDASQLIGGPVPDGLLSGNVALLDASQTFSSGLNTFGDIALQNSSAGYHHLVLSGGNSLGYLYGSYAAFGDGIHLGYNYYADADGDPNIPNTGGGTSRISAGYGYIGLYTGDVNQAPTSGMTIYGGNVTVTDTGIGFNSPSPGAALDLGPSGNLCGGNIIYRNGTDLWGVGILCAGGFGFTPNNGTSAAAYIDTSGNYHQLSDHQLKRDVTNLEHTLGRVLKLRPVSYHFRDVADDAPLTLGFLAQEVEPLFPEVVGEQTNGLKDLVYSELVPVAIRSIQELNQKVESQTAALQTENAELKTRLEKLERLINAKTRGK